MRWSSLSLAGSSWPELLQQITPSMSRNMRRRLGMPALQEGTYYLSRGSMAQCQALFFRS